MITHLVTHLITYSQRAVDHFQIGGRLASHTAEPGVPGVGVNHAIGIAQCIRTPADAVLRRYPTQQRHTDLRAESGTQPQRVLHRISAALRQVQRAQLWINFLEVGHRRHHSRFQRFHRQHIFHACTHRVAGEALGVSDHNLVRTVTKDVTQRMDLRRSTAAARGGVGFVRDENRLRSDLMTANAASFRFAHQILHHLADVMHVETGAVKRAIGGHRAQNFADGLDAPFAGGLRAFHHQASGAHADDHAVAAAVEGKGGFFDHFVGGRCSTRQEAGAHPSEQIVGSDVVGCDHDHAAATPRMDPVLGQRHALCGARAGSIDAGVRTTRADEFSELRMSHRQDTEQEATVENIRLFLYGVAQIVDALLNLLPHDGMAIHFGRPDVQAFQHGQLLALAAVRVIARHFVGERVQARKRRGKNHSCVIAQSIGQCPPVGQLRPFAGGLVAQNQRNAGVAQ